MTSNTFATPDAPVSGDDFIKWGDHKGSLVIVEPTKYVAEIDTSFGKTDAVEAMITVVDGPGAPRVYMQSLIFPRMLVAQTKGKIGEKVLGRVGQGKKTEGKSAPWLLLDATDADVAKATEFLTSKLSQPASAPAGRQSFSDDAPPF